MAAEGLFSSFFPSDLGNESVDPLTTSSLQVDSSHTSPTSDYTHTPLSTDTDAPKDSHLTGSSLVDECDTHNTDQRVNTPMTIEDSPADSPAPNSVSSLRNEDNITPLMDDPSLPAGWSRKVTQRTMGASAGKYDVYLFSPEGKKFRSRTDLMVHIARNNLDLNPNDFDFSVRGRANTPLKRSISQSASHTKRIRKVPSKLTNDITPRLSTARKIKSSSNGTSQGQSSGTKLIVKFNFPIARLKRSASMRVKKTRKKKVVRQDSQISQASDDHCSHTSEHSHGSLTPRIEYHEELSNGEARLTNGLDFEPIL